MPNSSSSSATFIDSGSNDTQLKKIVGEYKRIYKYLLAIGWITLVCALLYIGLLYSESKLSYHALDSNLAMGDCIAVDSSGQTIAFPVYNYKDLTVSILVTFDSGKHFEQRGGPWKATSDTNFDIIKFIKIAPDNNCIVAVGTNYIYLKASSNNIFTRINTSRFPSSFKSVIGFCFVPKTDSAYMYDSLGNIFCINYKVYDSVSIGNLKNNSRIKYLSVDGNKNIWTIGYNSNYPYYNNEGVFLQNSLENLITYAVVSYNHDVDEAIHNSPDTATITSDTTKLMEDTTKMDTTKMDTTKKM